MEVQYIDTHAHLNLSNFDDDIDEVVERCQEASVAVNNVGTTLKTSKRAVELAERYNNLYATIGLHPVNTAPGEHEEDAGILEGETFDVDAFRELAKSPKVIAIGECGYDFYRQEADTKDLQEAAFVAQIELANELGLPLMIHTRDAKGNQASAASKTGSVYDVTYATLKQYAKVPFNIHFYAGTWEQAERFIDIGGTISFTGVITFAKDYEDVVRQVPLDKLHAETDCPFVAPVPHRGKRAEPWMVMEVYKKIAAIKGLDEKAVREQLIENAHRQYQL